jgi:hypothetical protein
MIKFNELKDHDTVIIVLKDGKRIRGWRACLNLDDNILYFSNPKLVDNQENFIKNSSVDRVSADEVDYILPCITMEEYEKSESKITCLIIIAFALAALYLVYESVSK